jgi:hypothetical protein
MLKIRLELAESVGVVVTPTDVHIDIVFEVNDYQLKGLMMDKGGAIHQRFGRVVTVHADTTL